MKKTLVLFLAFALCLALAAPVLADGAPHTEVSRQTLKVDGEIVKCEKYNIGGYNYFKLRDLAALLSYTGSRFGVGWDAAANTVSITTGGEYEWTGKELLLGQDASATAQKTAQTILIDGERVTSLDVYNLGGSNYFKLADLGDALGFGVFYDADTNTAVVKSRPEKYLVSGSVEVGTYSDGDWDEDDNYTETTGKVTYTTTYTYTAAGLLASETTVTEKVPDGGGKATKETETWTYAYDADGNMTTRAFKGEGSSFTETSTYDAKGNCTARTVKSVSGDYEDTETYAYTYNDRGYVAGETYQSGAYSYTTVYTYDERNNLLSEKTTNSDGDEYGVDYTYDAAGNCLTNAYTGFDGYSSKAVFTYNAAGQILTESNVNDFGNGDVSSDTYAYAYDANGNCVKKEFSYTQTWDGETSAESTVTVSSYDAAGRLLREETTNSDGTSSRSEYAYDAEGRLLTWNFTGTGEYDSPCSCENSYDAQGNLVREVWTDEDGTGTTTYTYDAAGNLLSRVSDDGSSYTCTFKVVSVLPSITAAQRPR